MRHRLFRWIRDTFLLITLTLGVFLLVNLVAHLIFQAIRIKGSGLNNSEYFIPPLSPEGQEILRANLPADQFQSTLELVGSDPGFRAHPVLGFTEAFSRPGYRIGLESIRYQEGWSDEQVGEWLRESRQHTFLFGGSTGFGHGVSGNRTVAAQLGQLRRDGIYLNFSIQAYDSIREVDRLLHLLRLGYRPARVIFIDGLNDLTTFSWSPYRPLEKPRTQAFIMDRGEVALTFGHPRNNNMIQALIFSLPAVQLIRHWQWLGRFRDFHYQPRRADLDFLDWQELMFYYNRWPEFQPARAANLTHEWIGYYQENVNFIRALGEQFGFESVFVLQPLGPATARNPFVRKIYTESDLFHLYSTFLQEIQKAVRQGQLEGVVDCSAALDSEVSESYVDLAHYSALGNRLLAECIFSGSP